MRLVRASALCLAFFMYAWADPTIDQRIFQAGNSDRADDRLVVLENLA